MRVLHVLASLDPAQGGTVVAVWHMAAAMLRCGVQAEVVGLETPDPDWANGWPVKVHWLGGAISYYRYTRRLVPWLERNHSSYDVIVVHGVWRYPSVGVWRALRKTATPYFLLTHGMLDPWFKRAYPGKHIKKTLFWRLFEHRVLRDARAVLFLSEGERRLARTSFRPYSCREHVIGLGISAPPDDAISQRETFFRRFPQLRGKRLILFLGRLHRTKGCDLLVRAFGAVAPANSSLHLLIAGPDEERLLPELQRLAAADGIGERITWAGRLDGSLKWGAFRAAEVFALPSHTESYGVAIVEALACGIPVLITDKVNIWREIAGAAAGLTANDDIGGVTDLLQRWCALAPDQRRALGINARRCYRNHFDLDGFASRLVDYLVTATEVARHTA